MKTDESIPDTQTPKVRVVGVRLRDKGKILQCDPQDLYLQHGEHVLLEGEGCAGEALAQVKYGLRYVPRVLNKRPMRRVLRKLTSEEIHKLENQKRTENEAAQYCISRIAERHLSMKLVDVAFHFTENKMTFYFSADERIDFRELVKDLAYKYRGRIDMRQIGLRDGARMMDGIGPCGRPLCCSTFLMEFNPVSIKMARDQDLALNPAKTTGLCGKLKCCIAFEHEDPKSRS